ncbi:hypothetical protein A3762_12535 [Oleiphilus sp. HI0125]|uniref:DUF4402 domain-containing protein n=1 Tax=Oleiphilus sp. HI0125 TaxID=1822266 RepID=UPI0007C29129|nr:DUF4402 domain-containing protein [Oleiphilus sp. HI0125]KZZ63260.1 hypothetical protein A3762_12535 [Oleiphilus sp. HI0125]
MKNVFKKAAIATTLVSGLGAGMAHADTFQALLQIVTPISLSETTTMNLGQIDPSADAVTCTLAAGGARSGTGCFDAATNGVEGVIDVAGTDGLTFDITLGQSSSNGMTFVPAMIDNGESATTLTGVTLDGNGHQLTLGGTLTVDSATTAAAAAATATSIDYDVSVVYN